MRRKLLHIGCGHHRLPIEDGWINLDAQNSMAVDYVEDLSVLDYETYGPVDLVFSNAFFEHLFRSQHAIHLQSVGNTLRWDGIMLYMGIPYFPEIAACYLNKSKPTFEGLKTFDEYNVYRYTHGDPDGEDIFQLHKSVFDAEYLDRLLMHSSFQTWYIFAYAHPADAYPHRVTCGFFAGFVKLNTTQINEWLNYFADQNMILRDEITVLAYERIIALGSLHHVD